MYKYIRTSHNQLLELGRILGSGGEGDIFELRQNTKLCVKIYKPEIRLKKEKKVKDLIQLYKNIKQSGNSKIISIFDRHLAMPREIVYSPNSGEFLGFIMNKFDMKTLKSISFFYDSDLRHDHRWNKDWYGRYVLALNLLETVKTLHNCGIIAGDLNEKNIFVNESNEVVLFDCDSFGIVGKHNVDAIMPDIEPPEKNLTQKSDIYVLAIIIYKLFMDGFSPFQFKRPPDCSLEGREIMRMGLSPLRNPRLEVPPKAPRPEDRIPSEARPILAKAIDPVPDNRPNIDKLIDAVEKIFHHCQNTAPTQTKTKQPAGVYKQSYRYTAPTQTKTKQPAGVYKQSYRYTAPTQTKTKQPAGVYKVLLPVILSLIIPGLGQIYKGEYITGTIILVLVLIFNMYGLIPLGFLLWLYSIYDARK